jgi:ABC-type multidrug transport system fused ATPase/permease subunit
MNIKRFIKKYFQYFSYFYSHLKYRVFISLLLSLFVGVLDGFGLSMFLPLLQMADGSNQEVDTEQMGSLSFLVEGISALGIPFNLYSILLIILFFFTFKGLMKFLEGYLRVVYQQFFIRNIRISNTESLANFSYNNFVNADSGRIQNTFTGEVERVNSAYRAYFMAVQAAVLVMVYVVLAFLSNPQFALLITIGGGLSNLLFKKLYATTKKRSRRLTKEMHAFQGLLIQKVHNFKYLKATALIFKYAEKLKSNIVHIEKSQKVIGVLSATLQAMREPITMLIVVTVIIIQVEYLGGTLGLIILSLLFFYRALTFLMSMQNQWNTFLGVSGSLDNMTEFSNELKDGVEEFGKEKFEKFESQLQVHNLSFSYPGINILNNISLSFNRNEIIAIVGESGSGKTTLVNILVGLLKPENGYVKIDNLKMREMDIRTFQSKIGYITQEPVIFNDTIFNNICFWEEKNDLNLEKFQSAIEKASMSEFLNTLEKKEDTELGNNGINLSGGQRQRISIARELYKDVEFLVMDEATSALDSETEKAIQENIDALKGKYTIITIAHRLSTVKNADKIILLKKGEIDKIGRFDELIDQSPTFKRMVNLQEF